MNKINFSSSQQMDEIFQEAVDKAIEQHRIRGESVVVADQSGEIQIINAKDIIPLAAKLEQRKACKS